VKERVDCYNQDEDEKDDDDRDVLRRQNAKRQTASGERRPVNGER